MTTLEFSQLLGNYGELVGAIAIVVTLIYLATQIRQSTAQQKREELVSIQHGQNAVVSQLQDPRLMGGYVRTATERNPSIQDRAACITWVLQYLNHFEVVHGLYKNGALDDEQYQLWVGFAVAITAPKGVQRWWYEENGRLAFQQEVRDLIDRRLEDRANPPVPITEMWGHFDGEEWSAVRQDKQLNDGRSDA